MIGALPHFGGWDVCIEDGAAARKHSNPRLATLARKIVPRYNWSDLVLPEDQLIILRELVATVRGRPIVLDEWGLGAKLVSGAGITVIRSDRG